jgi:O-antigen/teichoic acid export membrane protein
MLAPYALSGIVLGQIDRIIINKTEGAADAGLYSLAYNVGMLVLFVSTALHSALTPTWFELTRGKRHEDAHQLVLSTFSLTLAAALGVVLFADELVVVFASDRFHEAAFVVPVVAIGYIFHDLFRVYGRSVGFTNKMVWVSATGVLGGAVNVALNAIFIPRYGYGAGAYTTVVSFALMAAGAWLVARFHLREPTLPLLRLARPLGLFAVAIGLYYALAIPDLGFWLRLVFKGLIVVSFGAVVVVAPALRIAVESNDDQGPPAPLDEY